ncbi:hypothetical protein F5Y05DRAFT_407493 [Hypoxylon sp. FL0543]|nr:hypothetical protein F5Y05DRAFT_407493 [Hypoxylon sp. FL0543]
MSDPPYSLNYDLAWQAKEELIDNCVQTWLSNGELTQSEGGNALRKFLRSQFRALKGDDAEQRPFTVGREEEAGYRSVSLDDRPPSDPRLLEQRRRLNALRDNHGLRNAVNLALDQEIEARQLVNLHSNDLSIPKDLELEFYHKVRFLAKFRLLQGSTPISPAPMPMLNPLREPGLEGQVKLWMVRVTQWDSLYLETFLAPISPKCCLNCFRAILETVAEPYANVGTSNRMIPSEDITSWSYRVSDFPDDNSSDPIELYTRWLPLNTKEQYERMSSLIKEHDRSAVFTRTSEIDEVRRIARETRTQDRTSN